MFEKLRRLVRQLRQYPVGQRFTGYHNHLKSQGVMTPGRRAAVIGLGSLMVLVGVIISLPPILSGAWLWIPGLAVLGSQIYFVARILDRLDLALHRAVDRFRKNNAGEDK